MNSLLISHNLCVHFSFAYKINPFTLILLKWRIWWAPNNASKRQMGFNSACKELRLLHYRKSAFWLSFGTILHSGKFSIVKKFLNPKSCYYSFTKKVQANTNLSFVNINYAYIPYSFPSWVVLCVFSLIIFYTRPVWRITPLSAARWRHIIWYNFLTLKTVYSFQTIQIPAYQLTQPRTYYISYYWELEIFQVTFYSP
jgi:hypothetical protein